MNEKKQTGFRLTYLIVAVVVALLVALLFVDFGNHGKELNSSTDWLALFSSEGYNDGDNIHKADYVVFKDGKAYVIEVGSKFSKEQVPRYSDFTLMSVTMMCKKLKD